MPSKLVRTAVQDAFSGRLPTWEGIQERLRSGVPDPTFIDVAAQVIATGSFDNVSNTAMRLRLLDLKLVVDASDPQRSLFRDAGSPAVIASPRPHCLPFTKHSTPRAP